MSFVRSCLLHRSCLSSRLHRKARVFWSSLAAGSWSCNSVYFGSRPSFLQVLLMMISVSAALILSKTFSIFLIILLTSVGKLKIKFPRVIYN